jgi:hypothetical protein
MGEEKDKGIGMAAAAGPTAAIISTAVKFADSMQKVTKDQWQAGKEFLEDVKDMAGKAPGASDVMGAAKDMFDSAGAGPASVLVPIFKALGSMFKGLSMERFEGYAPTVSAFITGIQKFGNIASTTEGKLLLLVEAMKALNTWAKKTADAIGDLADKTGFNRPAGTGGAGSGQGSWTPGEGVFSTRLRNPWNPFRW